MEPDPYKDLLASARELKLSRATPGLLACVVCGEKTSDGYMAPCCGVTKKTFVCASDMKDFQAQETYSYLFTEEAGVRVCTACGTPLASFSPHPLLRWIPAAVLTKAAGTSAAANGVATAMSDAWNFKLFHSCGQEYVVIGWSECDQLEDGCTKCHARNVSLSGAVGHTFQIRDLLNQLSGFHARSSARVFAQLKGQFPDAWKTFALTELLQSLQRGDSPDLSLWAEDTVKFMKANAGKILAELK